MLCQVTLSSVLKCTYIWVNFLQNTQPHCPQRYSILYNNVCPLICIHSREEHNRPATQQTTHQSKPSLCTLRMHTGGTEVQHNKDVSLFYSPQESNGRMFWGKKTKKKKSRNRWAKLGVMLQIYSIHRPERRPWPQNRLKHHRERRRHTASFILQLGTRRRLSGQLHALATLPHDERIALTE